MSNIVLIGFMGSGKTSIGKTLAAQFDKKFIDMDREIELESGRSIRDIFEEEGESYFRDLETDYLERLQGKKNKIISTGGGVILKEENVKLLHHIGTVVFLQANVDHIIRNTSGDTKRPLLQVENVEETIGHMLEEREPKYLKAANVIIQTSNKSIEAITNEIKAIL